MGWCPDYNTAKQVQYNQFADEKIRIDDNGRNNIDLTKMGWGNKYRNFILLLTLTGIISLGPLFLIIYHFGFIEEGFQFKILLKGFLIAILLIPLEIWYMLRELNRIGTGKKEKNLLTNALKISTIYAFIILLFITIGSDAPFEFLCGLLIGSLFIPSYHLVVYWEKKNKKTIYLIEEGFLRWQAIALPAHEEEEGRKEPEEYINILEM